MQAPLCSTMQLNRAVCLDGSVETTLYRPSLKRPRKRSLFSQYGTLYANQDLCSGGQGMWALWMRLPRPAGCYMGW